MPDIWSVIGKRKPSLFKTDESMSGIKHPCLDKLLSDLDNLEKECPSIIMKLFKKYWKVKAYKIIANNHSEMEYIISIAKKLGYNDGIHHRLYKAFPSYIILYSDGVIYMTDCSQLERDEGSKMTKILTDSELASIFDILTMWDMCELKLNTMKEYYIELPKTSNAERVRLAYKQIIDKAKELGYSDTISEWDNKGYDGMLYIHVSEHGIQMKAEIGTENEVNILTLSEFLRLKYMKYKEGDLITPDKGKTRHKIIGIAGGCYHIEAIPDGVIWHATESGLHSSCYSLLEDSVTELTMADIAKKFDVPVESIRIKDYRK